MKARRRRKDDDEPRPTADARDMTKEKLFDLTDRRAQRAMQFFSRQLFVGLEKMFVQIRRFLPFRLERLVHLHFHLNDRLDLEQREKQSFTMRFSSMINGICRRSKVDVCSF